MHEQLLREDAAADRLGMTTRALQAWRVNGRGPRFIRISARAVRYDPRDLDDWIEARRVRSTSDPTPAEREAARDDDTR
ncbi:MAG: helix-turn-helix domain-containing protein [Deltaproteobacteria bacterium]|nr:helix-turn-helix domain-containing protein [Deltaproteobacteria bacterium]